MTQHVSPADAARAATAVTAALATTRPKPKKRVDAVELLRLSVGALQSQPKRTFNTVRDIEHMDIDELRAIAVGGTMFEVMAQIAQKQGAGTCHTIGDIMRTFEMDRDDIHDVTCFCHMGSATIDGDTASVNLSDLGSFRHYRAQQRAMG